MASNKDGMGLQFEMSFPTEIAIPNLNRSLNKLQQQAKSLKLNLEIPNFSNSIKQNFSVAKRDTRSYVQWWEQNMESMDAKMSIALFKSFQKNEKARAKERLDAEKLNTQLDQNVIKQKDKTNQLQLQLRLYKEQSTRQVKLLQSGNLKGLYDPNDLNTYTSSVKKLSASDNDLIQKMKILDSQFRNIKTSAQTSAKSIDLNNGKIRSLGATIKKSAGKFMLWMGITGVFFTVTRAIRSMVSEVFSLNTAQTELNKVLDVSTSRLDEYTQEAFKIGEAIGRTTKDVLDASAEAARAGYSLGDGSIQALSKQALLLTNVSEGLEDTAEAAGFLISTMKAYDIQVEKSSKIVDLWNHISNNMAIETVNLAEIFKRSSATMAQAGNSMEEFASLSVGAFEILRDAPRVATGNKFVARLQQAPYVQKCA